eukprot:CAMPEP_0198586692 /NCGR_PEP_ID=MMETSP1462-20131121/130920_1 /TAXON_ID=1333877 /ORGANISM="Brandtodinium nutriculum, Strain RCC3387" /LENGTH=104 /DNA_ID=CAMNT_0044318151 /DNA_START=45 /DNA_END=356 /DNA_ORIENTATION=+
MAGELGTGYTSVTEAHATVPEDKARILADIGANVEDVDASIRVLIDSGMSTPTLRDVARRGIDLRGTATWRSSMIVTAFGPWAALLFYAYYGDAHFKNLLESPE